MQQSDDLCSWLKMICANNSYLRNSLNIIPHRCCVQGCWQHRQRPEGQWGHTPWGLRRRPRSEQVPGTPQMTQQSMRRRPPTHWSPQGASQRGPQPGGRRPRAVRSPDRRCRGRGRPWKGSRWPVEPAAIREFRLCRRGRQKASVWTRKRKGKVLALRRAFWRARGGVRRRRGRGVRLGKVGRGGRRSTGPWPRRRRGRREWREEAGSGGKRPCCPYASTVFLDVPFYGPYYSWAAFIKKVGLITWFQAMGYWLRDTILKKKTKALFGSPC